METLREEQEMSAMNNIETLNKYKIEKIVKCALLKMNPELGGNYEV